MIITLSGAEENFSLYILIPHGNSGGIDTIPDVQIAVV
jgi:hypothetical protein